PTKKPAVPSSSFDVPNPSVIKTIDEASPGAIVVDTQKPKPVAPKPAAVDAVEPAAPDAVGDGAKSTETISGLMSMPSRTAEPGPQTLGISQGVSQGLLVKKVAPVSPQQATMTRTQGAVQLLATISKDGDITHVKIMKGEPMLAQAAVDAVKQWKYKP